MVDNVNDIFSNKILSQADGFDSSLSKDELIEEIMSKLQEILVKRFPNNPQRQKIKVYPDRINFAAPCCGDSATNNLKKRGNIILSGPFQMTYKCHNCGRSMPIYTFFKQFGQTLSLGSIDYITSHKPDASVSNIADSSSNYLYDTTLIDSLAIDREQFKSLYQLEECNIPNAAYYYLINRKQYNFKQFLYQPKYQLLFLLNLTASGKIFGLQIAHLNKGYNGPKYKTYKLSRIYTELLKTPKEIPEEIDFLSMIFNILTINYNVPVTIVEGPMDSFLIRNCIATCGAGKHIKFDFKYRYLFDDDKTGRKHALEKLADGYEVFMWDRFKSDLGLPNRLKWDMNDVVIYCSDNNIKIPRLDNYFSNDNLDSLSI